MHGPISDAPAPPRAKYLVHGLLNRVGIAHQHADAPHTFGLLRSGGERPHRCAAKKRDELAPSHCLPEA